MHKSDLNAEKINGGVLDEKYVVSCRCRTGRSIRGLALPPHCTRAERREVERIVANSLSQLKGDFTGSYYPLHVQSDEDQVQRVKNRLSFEKPVSPLFTCAGISRDWPDSRGIWHNNKKDFQVWVNEKDHVKLISMQKGGNMKQVFERFCNGIKQVEESIMNDGEGFMWNKHLGYITTCPSNLGTGLRASVHVKLPLMAKVRGTFRHFSGKLTTFP